MQMNLAGAKRGDGKAWTWQHVFPQPDAPEAHSVKPRPPRAPTAKADPIKVFRLWKTGKVQT